MNTVGALDSIERPILKDETLFVDFIRFSIRDLITSGRVKRNCESAVVFGLAVILRPTASHAHAITD